MLFHGAAAAGAAGGAGKTTMAKLLFNHLAPGFTHAAMIELQPYEGTEHAAQHLAAALAMLGAKPRAGSSTTVLLAQLRAATCSYVAA